MNKVISAGQYSSDQKRVDVNEFLGEKAMAGWREDPLFIPFYHDTGLLMSACTKEGLDRLGVRVRPGDKLDRGLVELSKPEDFRGLAGSGVLKGDFPGWKVSIISYHTNIKLCYVHVP